MKVKCQMCSPNFVEKKKITCGHVILLTQLSNLIILY